MCGTSSIEALLFILDAMATASQTAAPTAKTTACILLENNRVPECIPGSKCDIKERDCNRNRSGEIPISS
jgi:hypothetical protein